MLEAQNSLKNFGVEVGMSNQSIHLEQLTITAFNHTNFPGVKPQVKTKLSETLKTNKKLKKDIKNNNAVSERKKSFRKVDFFSFAV